MNHTRRTESEHAKKKVTTHSKASARSCRCFNQDFAERLMDLKWEQFHVICDHRPNMIYTIGDITN